MPQYDEVTREQLRIHTTYAAEQEAKHFGVSAEEMSTPAFKEAHKEEIKAFYTTLRDKRLATAGQYIENRIARMSDGDAQFLERKQRITANIRSFYTNYANAARVEQQLRETRQTVFHKGISNSQLGKRRKKALQKQQTTWTLMVANKRHLTLREGAMKSFLQGDYEEKTKKSVSGLYMTQITENNPYFDVLSDYAAYYESVRRESETHRESKEEKDKREKLQKDVLKAISKSNLGKETQERVILDGYYDQVLETDVHEFDYATNEEFVNKYARMYPKLKALAGAKKIIDRMQQNGGDFSPPDRAAFMAKVDTLHEILTDYEARNEMLRSPYYMLLARKDIADLSPQKLRAMTEKPDVRDNPGLLDYVNSVLTLKQRTGFRMGSSASAIYKGMKKKLQKAEYENTRERVRFILKETDFEKTEDAILASQTSEMTLKQIINDMQVKNGYAKKIDENYYGNEWIKKIRAYEEKKIRAEYHVEDSVLPTFVQKFNEVAQYMDEETREKERKRAEELDRTFELHYLRDVQQREYRAGREADTSIASYAEGILKEDKNEEASLYTAKEKKAIGDYKELMIRTEPLLMEIWTNLQTLYDKEMKKYDEQCKGWK